MLWHAGVTRVFHFLLGFCRESKPCWRPSWFAAVIEKVVKSLGLWGQSVMGWVEDEGDSVQFLRSSPKIRTEVLTPTCVQWGCLWTALPGFNTSSDNFTLWLIHAVPAGWAELISRIELSATLVWALCSVTCGTARLSATQWMHSLSKWFLVWCECSFECRLTDLTD